MPYSRGSIFSPELELLLSILRNSECPATTATRNWESFSTLVEHHRVAPLVQARITQRPISDFPGSQAARLGAVVSTNARRALGVAAAQIRTVRRLENAGVETLSLKGLGLALRFYGSPGGRHIGDIDLLARPTDVARADALLREDGWERVIPDFPLSPRQSEEYLRLKPEFEYRHRADTLRLDLRWKLGGLATVEDALARAVTGQFSGHSVRTLPADLEALYLFHHGARHGWYRLFWLVDVAHVLRDPGFDAEATLYAARAVDCDRALLHGAALAEELLGVSCPPAVRPTARDRPHLRRLVADARRMIARRPQKHEGVAEWLRRFAYRLRLRRRAHGRFAAAAPHLFSPTTWRTAPLPDRWFFPYDPLTPMVWIWRGLWQRP
ncbi:MAG: hypothetical protein RLZZ15_4511 [Verrucomicrobiota bacterium]|jgi:hypothetical protein